MRTAKKIFLVILFLFSCFLKLSAQNQKASKAITEIKMGYSIKVFHEANPRDANAAILLWADALIKNFYERYKRNTGLIPSIYNSLPEIESALQSKAIDMLILDSSEYFTLKDKYNLTPAVAGIIDDNIFSQYILLVRNESGINKFSDLTNKNLSQPSDKHNPLLTKWLDKLLIDNNKPTRDEFFNKIIFDETDAKAVYSLFFKKSDCAIVQKSVYNTLCALNPQIGKTLKIIDSSPNLVLSFASYRKDADTSSIKLFYDVAKNINSSKEGSNILKLFKTKRLVEITDKDLYETKQLLNSAQDKKRKKK